LRSRIEAFGRTYFETSSENTDHLNALIALAEKFPIYKDQVNAERERLAQYPHMPKHFPSAPMYEGTNSKMYDEYEESVGFLMELEQQSFPYNAVEQRFNLWKKALMERRYALRPNKLSNYQKGYNSMSDRGYLAGYYSK
jgi:hypothetical protein